MFDDGQVFCILLKLFVAPFSWTDTQGRSHSSLRQMPTNKKLSKKERKEVQNAQGKSNQLMSTNCCCTITEQHQTKSCSNAKKNTFSCLSSSLSCRIKAWGRQKGKLYFLIVNFSAFLLGGFVTENQHKGFSE